MAPRDYKQRPPRAPALKQKRPVSAWLMICTGFVMGVLATVAVFIYEPEVSVPGLIASKPSVGHPAPVTPRFDFYKILPEKEIAVPDTALIDPVKTAIEPLKTDVSGPRYILQVGSFRRLQDADRLKAQLALLGLEATIQTVSIDGTETWHRVRVGPYAQLAKLKAARSRLKQERLEPIVLKLKN